MPQYIPVETPVLRAVSPQRYRWIVTPKAIGKEDPLRVKGGKAHGVQSCPQHPNDRTKSRAAAFFRFYRATGGGGED